MIHGMWCGPWVWKKYRTYFEALGYLCHTPSLPHHDAPPHDPPPGLGQTGLLDYVQYLEKYIADLGLRRPIVIGHSMGGLLAQIVASRDLARAAVLLTPAAPYGIFALYPSVLWSFRGMIWRSLWHKPIRPSFNVATYAMLGCLSCRERRDVHRQLVHESGRAATEIGFWFLFWRSRPSRVDRIACPVLTIAADYDRITPPRVVEAVSRKYAAVSHHESLPDHAHWVIGESGWEDTAKYLASWLRGLPR